MKIIWYSSWDIRWNGQRFLSVWAIFVIFPSKQPKKSKFWKNEKKLQETLSFYTCVAKMTIMFGSWDLEYDRIFYHFGRFLALLPPCLENQNFEKII